MTALGSRAVSVGDARSLPVEPPDALPGDPAALEERRARNAGTSGSRRVLVAGIRVVVVVAFLWFWEFVSGKPGKPHVLLDHYYVSKPSEIWEALRDWIHDGRLWSNVVATYRVAIGGFVVGSIAGAIVGFILGASRLAGDVLKPIVNAINSIPKLALLPLFFLWLGFDDTPRYALVSTVVFFLVFFNTFAGVREVDQGLVDMMRVMQAKRRHIFTTVLIPATMTWIITSMQFSVPYALVTAVTAEMLASNKGVGSLLTSSSSSFFTPGVFAAVVVMMAMSLALTSLMSVLESRLLRWKKTT
ncbi:MAG: ABC transporter permease [Actinomycetota bacterium]